MDIVEGLKTAEEFQVFISKPGRGDGPPIRVRATDTLRNVLARAGVAGEEGMLAFFPKDAHGNEDDERDDDEHEGEKLSLTLSALGVGRGARIVCSCCKRVEVTIQFQQDSAKHRFQPSARIRRVLRWARRHWNLQGEDGETMKLRLCGSEEDLKESSRLAELLTGRSWSLCVELVPGPRVNG